MDIQNSLIALRNIGLTQTEIAVFIGCNQSTISDVMNGKAGTVRPSYKIVCGIKKLMRKHAKQFKDVEHEVTK